MPDDDRTGLTGHVLGVVLRAVIDDNESFRRAMCSVLISEGFAAESFSSVASFVESGGLSRARCLVLDVAMPGIDGLAFQSCLRGTNYDIPIIFCSGASDDATRLLALESGAVCFLKKPVTAADLIECVNTALAKQRSPASR